MSRFLHRLGVASARHPWAVLMAWLVVAVVVGLGAATGTRFSDDGFVMPDSESSRALDRMRQEFPATAEPAGTGSLQLVLSTRDGKPVDAGTARARVTALVRAARNIEHVTAVSDPFDADGPYVSPDRSTAVATLSFTGLDDEAAAVSYGQVTALSGRARAQGLAAEVGGKIGDDTAANGNEAAELAGALVAFLILAVTYGSLVVAGANMLVALTGVVVGVLGVLAASALRPIGDTTPTMAVMIGLAVGIDYCLFIVARTRDELRRGHPLPEAIGRAAGTAGSAVVIAGATVIIALAGLALSGIAFIAEMGLAAAATVLIAILMALTLLPALTRTLGKRLTPRTSAARPRPLPGRWIRLVLRRPGLVAAVALAVLLSLSLPVLSMRTALETPGGDDPDSSRRAAYQQIAAAFGAGSQNPLFVVLEAGDAGARVTEAARILGALDGVTTVAPAGVNAADTVALLQITPDTGPVDSRTEDLVHAIRHTALGQPGVRLSVTGSTAVAIDLNEALTRALITYLALIVGLALLLLILLFRSLLVPVLATLGFLLSVGTAFGVTVVVFQWGWFGPLLTAPVGNPILSISPILVVGVLFGLAMDYQVFLVSRIDEARRAGRRPLDAISTGFGNAAVVVAAAALIMASVFGSFAVTTDPVVSTLGLALGTGVLADAFVVRMLLTPALLALLRDKAWWLPRWLDRVLPHLDPEGDSGSTVTDAPTAIGLAAPSAQSGG
jgi:RND superfamily putative drug exporter